MTDKIIILSAPSGTGKSTIIKHLMQTRPDLRLKFSISATSRMPREGEEHGREYYFISPEEFRKRIEKGEFVEWEEVYPGTYYGTLESEINRIAERGDTVIMDVDVKGGVNIKERFGDRALSIFLLPPTLEELEKRLRGRGTETEQALKKRLDKAEYELSFSEKFDCCVKNDKLERAGKEIADLIENFKQK